MLTLALIVVGAIVVFVAGCFALGFFDRHRESVIGLAVCFAAAVALSYLRSMH